MKCSGQRIDWVALAMTGAGAHLLLRWLVLVVFLARLSSGPIGPGVRLLLGLKSGLLAAAAVTLLILWRRRSDRPVRESAAILAGSFVVVGVYWIGPFGIQGWDSPAWSMVPALAVALTVGGLACRRRYPLPGSVLFVVTLACAATVHGMRTPDTFTQVNSLGLVSCPKNRVVLEDYAGRSNIDRYPPCTFRCNSLGYRDDEPPASLRDGRRRILIVGDSYVWGDGIPTNEETIGRLLAAELERAAPGRYAVMSAAYPGLGLYGYGRIVDALAPLYRPEAVVVGYLGGFDYDPLDPQFLADHLPENRWARNLVLGLRVAREVHESSVDLLRRFEWRSRKNEAYFEGLLRAFARRAAERGYGLLFLSYYGESTVPPPPARTMLLPDDLRYPGHADALWYGKECHPKPALNRILAKKLAAQIVGLGSASQ